MFIAGLLNIKILRKFLTILSKIKIKSAGVGRTGTYIAIDSLLEMVRRNLEINVFKFVNELREQRVLMVQKPVRIQSFF